MPETITKHVRSSNLEFYRIICMFMIVCHHYIIHSSILSGSLIAFPDSLNAYFLSLFGMWGKTGINCFLMITGYFMCKKQITIRKFLKLILWIYFYKLIIFGTFYAMGYENITIYRVIKLLLPIWGLNNNFADCFLVFWLTIPFLNALIRNITQRQHVLLMLLLVCIYSILGNIPGFNISFNYATWFGVIYVIASYIRFYPQSIKISKKGWAILSLLTIIFSMVTVVMDHHYEILGMYFFVDEPNKFLTLAVAISSFMFIKSIYVPYNKYINLVGASTFGVLLIHDNSDAMRQWLWKDNVESLVSTNCSIYQLVLCSVCIVLVIFIACILIDRVRIKIFEEPILRWYDKKCNLLS